jgi:hypothetical protein
LTEWFGLDVEQRNSVDVGFSAAKSEWDGEVTETALAVMVMQASNM